MERQLWELPLRIALGPHGEIQGRFSVIFLAGNAQEKPRAFCIANASSQNNGMKGFFSPDPTILSLKCR